MYFSANLTSLFIYDREFLLQGEIWRLLSCHIVHFSAQHLCYDAVVFSIAGSLIEYYGHLRWLLLEILMALIISSVLFLVESEMRYYGGLSGLAVGSVVYLAVFQLYRKKYALFWKILLFLTFSKILLEFVDNYRFFDAPFVPMPLSHLVGSVIALIVFYIEYRFFNHL